MDLLEVEVRVTDECLGSGAYGSVVKVINAKGEVCAGKIIHPLIIDRGNHENINVKKFTKECEIMFKVEHDNITKFLGLSRQPNLMLPILVMEKLEGNLYDLLEYYINPCLPLKVTVAILSNVADGLHYLHNHPANMCILHRDLTVMNVLLTSNLVGKIADFGVSRLFDDKYFPQIMTTGPPGHISYMPPEADIRCGDDNKIRYGPELDIFSFGHLALVALTQMVKENLMAATYPGENKKLIPRSELERRESFIEKLDQVLDEEPRFLSLKGLVTDCLHNLPEKRPTSLDIKQSLQVIKEEGAISQNVIDRGVQIIRNGEKLRTTKPMKFKFNDNIMKFSFILVMLLAGLLFYIMAQSGFLLETMLQNPLFSFIASGIMVYTFGFLFDFVFNGYMTRLFNFAHLTMHFPAFLSIWCVIFSILFMSFIPSLSLTTRRIIFRHLNNCNAFNRPTIYICYNLAEGNNQVFYTTVRRECFGNIQNATSFYITSLWIPSKNQFKLNKKIRFQPSKGPAYDLPSGYCIQGVEINDNEVKVDFYSWEKKGEGLTLDDTGFISRNDLDEFNSGWYEVSNCRWEISRLLSDCTTGYVSSYYVNVPEYMKALLHSKD